MAIFVLAVASPAAGFPAPPRVCPIADPRYGPYLNCLSDTEQRWIPTGSLANTTPRLQRAEVGISVSSRVVRYGQKFTVKAVDSFPPCQFDYTPTVPSGCVNSGQVGVGQGFYVRLLPLVVPELADYLAPRVQEYASMVRQSGPCTISTSCSYEFVRPGRGDAAIAKLLTSHWIVAGINVYINRGVEQGTNRLQWLQDPDRSDRLLLETAIRLCPPAAPCPSEVSGTVTQQGASRSGVGGLSVHATCSGSNTSTTTDPNGHYSLLLNPGRCPISIRPPAGEVAIPKQRVVHVDSRPVHGVDFQVGCSHRKAAQDAAAGAGCLDVQVKQFGQSRSGLAIYQHFDSPEDRSKAFFQQPFSHRCASGCTNLLVTVLDPQTHTPVTGATVDASVTPVRGAATGGEGFLCDQARLRACGSHLLDSTTDDAGEVHLEYWSPGLITNARPTVNVVVRDGSHLGTGERRLDVKPYLIYAKDNGDVSFKEALELAYWSAGTGLVGRLGKLVGGVSGLEKGLSFALNAFIGAEYAAARAEAALAAIEPVTPILGVLELAHLGSELWERQGFIASFLETLGLNPIGIDDNPFERSVSGAPSAGFAVQLANYGTAAPFHVRAGGVLWTYAKHLDALFGQHNVAFGAEALHIRVFEVSYCQEGEICGPGYRSYLGSGIHPALYIEISAWHQGRETFAAHAFSIPYDPNAWTEVGVQNSLRAVLP